MRDAVSHALKIGYRHLDCALIYQNEHEVGQGIKDSGVARSEIFITSKVWNTDQPDVAAGLEKTLKALGTDYVDLYVSDVRSVYRSRLLIESHLLADPLARSPCPGESLAVKLLRYLTEGV